MQRSGSVHTADHGARRDGDRRHAPAERRLGVRQLRQQLVHLTHLAIPIALLWIFRFHTIHHPPPPHPPPPPPRAQTQPAVLHSGLPPGPSDVHPGHHPPSARAPTVPR